MDNTSQVHGIRFGFITTFLTGLSLTIVNPVLPFIIENYTTNEKNQARMVTLIMSVYALSMFISAPILGSLSDKHGRRPILLISLLGSSLGYLIFGLGGALWVLVLGRMIEGISGGEIATIFAYFSDITTEKERIKYFGWLSAVVGVGTSLGPLIGGGLAYFGPSVPMYFGALLSLLNALYGYFFMPESLDNGVNNDKLKAKKINPIVQLMALFKVPEIKLLVIVGCFVWLASGTFQGIFPQLSMGVFSWQPLLIGISFSIIGAVDILVQVLIMPILLKKVRHEVIVMIGILFEAVGYLVISISCFIATGNVFLIGIIIYSFGDALYGPSFNGTLSMATPSNQQGQIQGSVQSLQSLSRVIGPLIGGQLYISMGPSIPTFICVVLLCISSLIMIKNK